MSKKYIAFGLIGCALSLAASASFAGPSKDDVEKALAACGDGQSLGDDGICAPATGKQMGFDFIPQGDIAQGGAKPSRSASTKPAGAHRNVASVAPVPPVQRGFVDLQMTFSNGSSVLTDTDKETANMLTQVLMEPANASKVVEIGGHTSSTGSASYNDFLSKKRAEAVKEYLVANGVPADRLEAVGYGSRQPLQGTDPAAPENRRVVLTMLGTKQP